MKKIIDVLEDCNLICFYKAEYDLLSEWTDHFLKETTLSSCEDLDKDTQITHFIYKNPFGDLLGLCNHVESLAIHGTYSLDKVTCSACLDILRNKPWTFETAPKRFEDCNGKVWTLSYGECFDEWGFVCREDNVWKSFQNLLENVKRKDGSICGTKEV